MIFLKRFNVQEMGCKSSKQPQENKPKPPTIRDLMAPEKAQELMDIATKIDNIISGNKT